MTAALETENTPTKSKLQAFVESSRFVNFVLPVIVLNSITTGMQTSKHLTSSTGCKLEWFVTIALVIYVIEIILKPAVHHRRFFADDWNLFDFFIVGIALLPNMASLSVMRSLRTLRALRGMRIISAVPAMRMVVVDLLKAIPGMLGIMALMGLIYYIGAMLTTTMFGAKFPEWFGTLGASFFTLFQCMTLESWSIGIVRPAMVEFPHAYRFFVPFIVISTFSMLNLFTAVIVSAVQAAKAAGKAEDAGREAAGKPPEPDIKSVDAEIDTLQKELAGLYALLKDRSGHN